MPLTLPFIKISNQFPWSVSTKSTWKHHPQHNSPTLLPGLPKVILVFHLHIIPLLKASFNKPTSMGVSKCSETSRCDSELISKQNDRSGTNEATWWRALLEHACSPAKHCATWSETEISGNGWIMQLSGKKLPGKNKKSVNTCVGHSFLHLYFLI